MALTQVKTTGLADDAITSAKIADDAVVAAAIADDAVVTAALADDAVTGANIADDTVAEANMANDAISLAELKAGTDGQIISWDASGNPVAIGPGTDGQVLTSTGAGSPPAFEAVPAGGATINNATENEIVTVASTTSQLDAESALTFDGTKVVLGGQTARALDGYQGTFQIEGTGDTTTSMSIIRNSNDNHAPSLNFGKSKGGANGDSTTVADASSLGQITFNAADGTDMECEGARIEAISWGSQASNNAPTALQFRTNLGAASSSVAGRFVPNGNFEIEDGNLKFAAGHGIDFSPQGDDATNMSSELFDDYEEGWFEPACTNSITWDAYNDRLYYRKVGNTCTIGGRLVVDNGQNGGVLNLSGLPFAHADHSDGTDRTLDHFFFHDWTNLHSNWDDSKCAFYQVHSTNMNLYIRNSSGDWTYFHPYDDGIISFNITYPTT